jgi:hypothetical protein
MGVWSEDRRHQIRAFVVGSHRSADLITLALSGLVRRRSSIAPAYAALCHPGQHEISDETRGGSICAGGCHNGIAALALE